MDMIDMLLSDNKKSTSEYVKQMSQQRQEQQALSGGYGQPNYNRGPRPGQSHGMPGSQGGGHMKPSMTSSIPLPPGYICNRCKVPGHHIKDCPTNADESFDTY